MIIERIKEKILEQRTDKPFAIRASGCGGCVRALAYAKLGHKGEPIGERGLLTFKHGDLVEQTLRDLVPGIYDNQREIKIIDGELVITGHIDGLYDWIHENGKETVVIDFKSINTRGFSRAEKGEVDYKYIVQMNLYMHALKLKKAVLVYFNKDTSHLCECVLHYDEGIVKDTLLRMHRVLMATEDSLPQGEYDIDDKVKGWVCSYCAYTELCYSDRHVEIVKGKPKYVKSSDEAGVKND